MAELIELCGACYGSVDLSKFILAFKKILLGKENTCNYKSELKRIEWFQQKAYNIKFDYTSGFQIFAGLKDKYILNIIK